MTLGGQVFNGEYRVYQGGRLLSAHRNLITNYGRQVILRYLAGEVSGFAGALAIGSDQTPTAVTDTALGFEFSRAPVHLKTPNLDTGEIILSASIDEPIAGVAYEFGIYPYVLGVDGLVAGSVILRFDGFEGWTGGTYNLSKTRVGNSSYQLTAAASNSTRASVRDRVFGIGELASEDTLSLSYFINDFSTNSITMEFHSTAGDYFRYVVDASASLGYHVTTWKKSDLVAVGSPSWDTVNYLDIVVEATAGGTTVVNLDALRIDNSASSAENKLVSRSVGTGEVKNASTPLDIEYVLRYQNG